MTRRIDKKTAHRRAAAPSIDFSMLPSSPEGLALREELERLREEERARRAAREQQPDPLGPSSSDTSAPPAAEDPPARSPYRGRDADGRTLQPLDAPAAARLEAELFGTTESADPAAPSTDEPPPVDTEAPTVPPLRQSQIPTLHLPRADQAPDTPADLPIERPKARHAAGRVPGPTIIPMTSLGSASLRASPKARLHEATEASGGSASLRASPEAAPRTSLGSASLRASPEARLHEATEASDEATEGSGGSSTPAAPAPARPPVAPPPPPPIVSTSPEAAPRTSHGSASLRASPESRLQESRPERSDTPHRAARAIHEPAVTAGDPDSDPGAYTPPPLVITSAPPRVDRHDTLVSQPPDAAFFAESAPIEEQEIADDIEGWERRRWIRRLGALAIVVLIGLALLIVAIAGAYTLYAETATSPLLPGNR